MCVDDYEFRSYAARREKVCRRFVVVDEEEITHTFFVNISQFQQEGQELALCKILIYLSCKGLIIDGKKFYVPKFKSIIEPYTFCRIKFSSLDETQVILKMYSKNKSNNQIFIENCQFGKVSDAGQEPAIPCSFGFPHFQMVEESMDFSNIFLCNQNCPIMPQFAEGKNEGNENVIKGDQISEKRLTTCSEFQQKNKGLSSEDSKTEEQVKVKRTRQPQRVIREVILLVKIWRGLHQVKKWSLIAAAKLIGISKKSLDDYYLVLRAGEILGYNFEQCMKQKMGELRSFIRAKDQKVSGKLGKVVESFNLVPEVDLDLLIERFQLGEINQN